MTFIILRALMPTAWALAATGGPAVFTHFPRSWRSRIQSAFDLRRYATGPPKASPRSSPKATLNMPAGFQHCRRHVRRGDWTIIARHASLLLITVSSLTLGIVFCEHTDGDGATIFSRARRIAINIARLPELLGKRPRTPHAGRLAGSRAPDSHRKLGDATVDKSISTRHRVPTAQSAGEQRRKVPHLSEEATDRRGAGPSFTVDQIDAMNRAFKQACARMGLTGSTPVIEIVAVRILELALKGQVRCFTQR
jgi:hypothetical protein